MELESDVDTESRKSAETIKIARKSEKKVKELQFQLEDDRKSVERAQDIADKLNQKLKKMRLQLEEAVGVYKSTSFLGIFAFSTAPISKGQKARCEQLTHTNQQLVV